VTLLLYLIYDLHLTPHARAHPDEFWAWTVEREPWFYEGLAMVEGTWWLDFGSVVQHLVLLADQDALTRYREAIDRKRENPAWEARRVSQDLWYTIPDGSRVAADPPVSLGVPVPLD
jgi:hypothetical protein